MNVFEDLIEELKQENLLEETIFSVATEPGQGAAAAVSDGAESSPKGGKQALATDFDIAADEVFAESGDPADDLPEIVKPANDKEFYRKRAIEEVSSLQMVEHVLSGVEREHMKAKPATYDDLAIKTALHKFLQATADANEDSTARELELMQETQNWCTALTARDAEVSAANIRRFCENSRPVLSSQALLALARFYRNSPYSELTRGKFDFVMTRLFSRDTGNNRRQLLFGRQETIGHISTLYSNWSSISLHDDADSREHVKDAVKKFGEFLTEIRGAAKFDDLIASEFFERVRQYKESCNELFFHPEVLAAVFECNIGTGNRFVDLVEAARKFTSPEDVEEKYGYAYDQLVSNAAGRTIHLLGIMRGDANPADFWGNANAAETRKQAGSTATTAGQAKTSRAGLFSVNKWLLAATILITAISGGIYFWAESAEERDSASAIAGKIDVGSSEIATEIKSARTSGESLYLVMQPTWDSMSEDEQKAILQKALQFGTSKGFRRVQLLNEKGRGLGYADSGRLDLQRR